MSRYSCAVLHGSALVVLGVPYSSTCSCKGWPLATDLFEVSGGWTGICCCIEVAISDSGRSCCVVWSGGGSAESAPPFVNLVDIVGGGSWGVAMGSTGCTTAAVLEVTSTPWSLLKSSRMIGSETVADELVGLEEVAGGWLVEGAVDGVKGV